MHNGSEGALIVVDQYKHLGSLVEAQANLTLEAHNRSTKMAVALAQISANILSSTWLGLATKKRLANSILVSRLVFNLHAWWKFEGKPRRIIATAYMRIWRRIAGKHWQGKSSGVTDAQLRRELQVPSIDCLVRKRRLKYLPRLLSKTHGLESLLALLSVRTPAGECLPWVHLIKRDLAVLKRHCPVTLAELPDPREFLTPWLQIAVSYPNEWNKICDKYFTTMNDDEAVPIDHSSPLQRKQQTAPQQQQQPQ